MLRHQIELIVLSCTAIIGLPAANRNLHISSSSDASCSDIIKKHPKSQDGIYSIQLKDGEQIAVYCDMTTDGGGWTVMQRHQDGSLNFSQDWDTYKSGFGNLDENFWLGNEYVSLMTTGKKQQTLRFDWWDFGGDSAYETYQYFSVGNESTGFLLTANSPSGTAGDSLRNNIGMKFTTMDVNNDPWPGGNCAYQYPGFGAVGGWWYNQCSDTLPNGIYLDNGITNSTYQYGLFWLTWAPVSNGYSAKKVEIKFRPSDF